MNRPTYHPLACRFIQALPLKGGRPLNQPHEMLRLPPGLSLQLIVDIGLGIETEPDTQDASDREHVREACTLLTIDQDSANCRQRDTTPLGEGLEGHSELVATSIKKPG